MRHYILLIILLSISVCEVFSQDSSTIYLITKKSAMDEVFFSINGGEYVDFTGTQMSLGQISPAVQKITVQGEGKIIISAKASFTPFKTSLLMSPGQQKHYETEFQCNIEPESIHYILLTNKGIDNIKLEEITEKKASKIMNNKKTKLINPTILYIDE